MARSHRDVGLQPLENKALSWGIIRKSACILAEITLRKSQKESHLEQVNHTVLQVLNPEHVEVEMCRSEELDHRRGPTSELDEMWSYVCSKANPRWLWHAIDHHTVGTC